MLFMYSELNFEQEYSTLYEFVLFIIIINKNNTIYELMWWVYIARYDTMYYNDVFTSGALQV